MIQNIEIIIAAVGGVGGLLVWIVAFFVMQAKQNMKIELLEKECKSIREEIERIRESGHRRAEEIEKIAQDHAHPSTDQAIALLGQKLDTVLDALKELKDVERNRRKDD